MPADPDVRSLFFAPALGLYSEVWLQRMLDGIRDTVRVLAARKVVGTPPSDIPFVRLHAPPKIRSYVVKVPLLRDVLMSYLPLQKAMDRENVNVALCHFATLATEFEPMFRKNRTPWCVHLHGFDVFPDLKRTNGKPHHPAGYLEQLIRLSETAVLIANSDFTRDHVIGLGLPPERVVRKYLGVPIPATSRPDDGTDEVTICAVGRMVDFKSPTRTVQAFIKACDMGLKGRLVMAGNGPLLEACEELRKSSRYADRIEFAGAIGPDKVEELYLKSAIFTQHNTVGEVSGQQEALGVAVLEAMSHGIPVVGTRSGALAETVEHGKTGLLVAPGDVDAQATALLELASNPIRRQALGSASRQRVIERFSIEQEARELRRILQDRLR